jgi:hypothetical protein
MLAITANLVGTIRYLRPDHNPLRRPIDRVHGRIVLAFVTVALIGGALIIAVVGPASYHSGLRTARLQAETRHPVPATVLSLPPAPSWAYGQQKTHVQWRDANGIRRTGTVPLRRGDQPGLRRTIWVDGTGKAVSSPNSGSHIMANAVAMAAVALLGFDILLIAFYLLIEHRLDRRRFVVWEREWLAIAPRWTGRP